MTLEHVLAQKFKKKGMDKKITFDKDKSNMLQKKQIPQKKWFIWEFILAWNKL